MKKGLALVLATGVGAGALGIGCKSASAWSWSGLDPAIETPAGVATSVAQVRWVCGPYRCHWAPGWHRRYWWGPGYGFYGPGPWWRYGYGYRPWWPHRHWWPHYGYHW